MDKIDRITVGENTYEIAPNAIFYAGDSWDRNVEPVIYAGADGSVTFNCSADDIKIGNTTLSNTISGNTNTTYAVSTVNSAQSRIDSLEKDVSYIYKKMNELDKLTEKIKGKRTLEDLIEPGEPEWISKMNLKTRKVGEFRKAQLLTI